MNNKDNRMQNLNGPTTDSIQLDYIARERKAAEELLKLQTKNAQQLSTIRVNLLKKLNDEALEQGKIVEDYLAEYGLQRRLSSLATELKVVQESQTTQADALAAAQKENNIRLISAEQKLGQVRAKQLAAETSARINQANMVSHVLNSAAMSFVEAMPRDVEAAITVSNETVQETPTANATTPTVEPILNLPEISNISAIPSDLVVTINAFTTQAQKELTIAIKTAMASMPVPASELPEGLTALTSLQNPNTDTSSSASSAVELAAAPVSVEPDIVEVNRHAESVATPVSRPAEESFTNAVASAVEQATIIENTVASRLKSIGVKYTKQLADYTTLRQSAEAKFLQMREEQEEAVGKASLQREEQRQLKKMLMLKNAVGKDGKPLFTDDQILDTASLEDKISKITSKLTAETEVEKAKVAAQLNSEKDAEIAKQLAEAKAAASSGEEIDESAIKARVEKEFKLRLEQKQIELDLELNEKLSAETTLAEEREAYRQKVEKKVAKQQAKQQAKREKDEQRHYTKLGKVFGGKLESTLKTASSAFSSIKSGNDRLAELMAENPEMTKAEAEAQVHEENKAAQRAMFDQIGGWADKLNEQGKVIASKQAAIDTRLQGTANDVLKTTFGSYYRTLETKVSTGIGISPFVRQEDAVASIEKLAQQGIAFNLQERAFLDTISEKIANTFNATDATLLKLVRIQQADTTAARLGMESALTSFLNSMYATSEYMTAAAESVRQNLYEATALMDAKDATAFEYQVQKWMGSLYSVGFSNSEALADALGKLASGDVGAITEGGLGNLLVMAANEASLPIANILEEGLTDKEANTLLESMVNYLGRIYEETKGSKVVSQQFAQVYGITASDLKAAANLSSSIKEISEDYRSYDGMLKQLNTMANSMYLRTSTGEMFQNALENFSYTMAATMGNNPVLSSLNNVANMLNDLVGGIEIPFVNVYGFGFDLNATVADLMNVAALSGSVLGGMGKLIASLGNGGGFSGSGMLSAFGVAEGSLDVTKRGSGGTNLTTQGGATTSESGHVGNESGDDVKNKTISDNSEGPEKQIAEAKEEQEDKENARTMMVVDKIVNIYDLLYDVTLGSKKFHVQLNVGNAPAEYSSATWN